MRPCSSRKTSCNPPACPRALTPGQDEQIELEEFDKFIEHIKPEDFVTHNGGKD